MLNQLFFMIVGMFFKSISAGVKMQTQRRKPAKPSFLKMTDGCLTFFAPGQKYFLILSKHEKVLIIQC
jgi:hypothetical protein